MPENSQHIPSQSKLQNLENLRQSGKLEAVARESKNVLGFPFDEFSRSKLSTSDKQSVLGLARHYVDSEKSMAAISNKPSDARSHLENAREGIVIAYNNPHVREFLESQDGKGLHLNILRDTAKYLTTLAFLSGDTANFQIACQLLDEASEIAYDASDRLLAQYESARLKSLTQQVDFNDITQKYSDSYNIAKASGQYERASSVAAFYAVDSIKNSSLSGFARAVFDFGSIMLHDRKNWRALPSQLVKYFTEKKRHGVWEKERDQNYDFKNLQV